MDEYTRQVLGNRPQGRGFALLQTLAWQLGGAVAIYAWCNSSYTLTQLQWVFGVVALVVGGLESNAFGNIFGPLRGAKQDMGQVFWFAFILSLGSLMEPRIAVPLWAFAVVRCALAPSVLAVSVSWFALAVLVRAFELFRFL